jgi:uncharacterized protein YbjT (DUF2867 family)
VHLAASIRDQPHASIEELNGMATLRLVRAAERAGARRFLFFSALGASHHSRTRFFRAKALAQDAVAASRLETTTFSPSIVYTPGDPWLTLLDRFSHLPAVPVSGSGEARFQPIWAEDVADGVAAALADNRPDDRPRYELAGPDTLSYDEIVRLAVRSSGRRRRLLHVPLGVVRASLRALRLTVGPHVFATWDEAELMEEPMLAARGTADAEALGVHPLPMAAVLGLRGPGPRPLAGQLPSS